MLFRIKIDATKLSSPSLAIPGVIEAIDTNGVQPLQLEPGSYSVETHKTSAMSWQFKIAEQGFVDYNTTLDVSKRGFLSGRNTSALVIHGFPITLDGTKLSTPTYFLNGVTNSLDSTQPQTLNLLPGHYQFYQGNNNPVPEADFEVGMDGQVHFPSSRDAILKWRDADHTLEIVGFPIALDGTALTAATFLVYGITTELPTSKVQQLQLVPGQYYIRNVSSFGPLIPFEISADGKVTYDPTFDADASPTGFMKGQGTSTIVLLGHTITIDARSLTTATLHIYGILYNWATTQVQRMQLLPGPYNFRNPPSGRPLIPFEITVAGTVEYDPSFDAGTSPKGFFKGRGTSTITLLGHTIFLDARALTTRTLHIYGILDNWPTAEVQKVSLLPGQYYFRNPPAGRPLIPFEIKPDGAVAYDPSADADANTTGYFKGLGTSRIELLGHSITVDASALWPHIANFYISCLPDALPTSVAHRLQLLPASYIFSTTAGTGPDIDFDVAADGVITYARERDISASPPGFLSGRWSNLLEVVGIGIQFDATAYVGAEVVLQPFGTVLDTSRPQNISLLPVANLRIEIRTAELKVAYFDLSAVGRIVLDDPYPFVELRWQGRLQVLRLTTDEVRQKGPCCLTLAVEDG